jgi:hypothetical protein
MAFENAFDDLFGHIDRIVRAAATTAERLPPSRERTLLAAVADKLKEARTDAATFVPAGLTAVKQEAEQQLAVAQRLGEEATAARRDLMASAEAASAPRPAAPAPAPPPQPFVPDPALGGRLRDDLLGRFGPPAADAPPTRGPGKDIWEDWV